MTADPNRYLVVGATGKTGRRVADALRTLGRDVRGVSRSTPTRFEWSDPESWDAALEGVDRVYLTWAPDLAIPGAVEAVDAFVDRAVEAGVSRLVLLSGRGEEEAQRAERTIQRPGLEWAVVRASWFAQNFWEGPFREMVLSGTVALPAGEVPEPFVDADDIAEVAVAVLIGTARPGRVYEVTGPRLLTFREAVDELSAELGREVRYQRISQEAFVAGLEEAGLPDGVAWLMDYLFTTVLDGRNAHVEMGVSEALGRPPTDFRDAVRRSVSDGAWESDR